MRTQENAEELAQSMVRTAQGLGIKTKAQITSMGQPIGSHVGNALEVIESIEVLQGKGSADTRNLVILQGGELLAMTDEQLSPEEGRELIAQVLDNGEALEKFRLMCVNQGVEEELAQQLVREPERVLPSSQQQTTILSRKEGHVVNVDSMACALLAKSHGAGRYALEDIVIPEIGFVFHVAQGMQVQENQPILTFYHNRELSENWPVISHPPEPPTDADEWREIKDKIQYLEK